MASKSTIAALLGRINQQGKKQWNYNEIKSMAKGVSSFDYHDDEEMEKLVKKVADAAGVKLSPNALNHVKNQVNKKVSQMYKK